MALTEIAIRTAKAGDKDRKLADGRGLYLLITPVGSKLWRLKFRTDGKERKLSLGRYPEMSLKDARLACEAARSIKQAGADPARAKREERAANRLSAGNTFGAIADEYIAKLEAEQRADVTIAKTRWLLGKLSPSLGKRPIKDITPHELLLVLRKSESAGHRETARRLRSFASRVFRYAVATARASHDPAQPLAGALVSPVAMPCAAGGAAGYIPILCLQRSKMGAGKGWWRLRARVISSIT